MKTIFENDDLIVVSKPYGVFSEDSETAESVGSILAAERGGKRFYPVNRLDSVTGGLMLLATDGKSAAELSAIVSDKGKCKKQYLCVVVGAPASDRERYEDLLFFDRMKRKTFVCERERRGVKRASLLCELLAHNEERDMSLLSVTLETGRTHQIRAQLSSRGMPIVFDGKYGSRIKREGAGIALFSSVLEFEYRGKRFRLFERPPSEPPFAFFEKEIDAFADLNGGNIIV